MKHLVMVIEGITPVQTAIFEDIKQRDALACKLAKEYYPKEFASTEEIHDYQASDDFLDENYDCFIVIEDV